MVRYVLPRKAAAYSLLTIVTFGMSAASAGPIEGSHQYQLQQKQQQQLNQLTQKYQQLGSAPGAGQEDLRLQYLNEAQGIKKNNLSQDTRGQMINDLITQNAQRDPVTGEIKTEKKNGRDVIVSDIENTGSPPKDVRSDVDLNAKTPQAGQNAIEGWQANGHVLEGADGKPLSAIDWNDPPYKVVDRTTDTTLWLPCQTQACLDAKAGDTDAWTTEGGLQGTGNSGRVRDPYGYYLDNEKKFGHGKESVESLLNGGTSDMNLDDGLKTVAKSLDKAGERAGLKDNSEIWAQAEALRNYADPVEAGIANPGDSPGVKQQKVLQWLQNAEAQMMENKGALYRAGQITELARTSAEESLLNSKPADPENEYQNALGAQESTNRRARVNASNATAEQVNSGLGGIGNEPPPEGGGTPELPRGGPYRSNPSAGFTNEQIPKPPPGPNLNPEVSGHTAVGAITLTTYAACLQGGRSAAECAIDAGIALATNPPHQETLGGNAAAGGAIAGEISFFTCIAAGGSARQCLGQAIKAGATGALCTAINISNPILGGVCGELISAGAEGIDAAMANVEANRAINNQLAQAAANFANTAAFAHRIAALENQIKGFENETGPAQEACQTLNQLVAQAQQLAGANASCSAATTAGQSSALTLTTQAQQVAAATRVIITRLEADRGNLASDITAFSHAYPRNDMLIALVAGWKNRLLFANCSLADIDKAQGTIDQAAARAIKSQSANGGCGSTPASANTCNIYSLNLGGPAIWVGTESDRLQSQSSSYDGGSSSDAPPAVIKTLGSYPDCSAATAAWCKMSNAAQKGYWTGLGPFERIGGTRYWTTNAPDCSSAPQPVASSAKLAMATAPGGISPPTPGLNRPPDQTIKDWWPLRPGTAKPAITGVSSTSCVQSDGKTVCTSRTCLSGDSQAKCTESKCTTADPKGCTPTGPRQPSVALAAPVHQPLPVAPVAPVHQALPIAPVHQMLPVAPVVPRHKALPVAPVAPVHQALPVATVAPEHRPLPPVAMPAPPP